MDGSTMAREVLAFGARSVRAVCVRHSWAAAASSYRALATRKLGGVHVEPASTPRAEIAASQEIKLRWGLSCLPRGRSRGT